MADAILNFGSVLCVFLSFQDLASRLAGKYIKHDNITASWF